MWLCVSVRYKLVTVRDYKRTKQNAPHVRVRPHFCFRARRIPNAGMFSKLKDGHVDLCCSDGCCRSHTLTYSWQDPSKKATTKVKTWSVCRVDRKSRVATNVNNERGNPSIPKIYLPPKSSARKNVSVSLAWPVLFRLFSIFTFPRTHHLISPGGASLACGSRTNARSSITVLRLRSHRNRHGRFATLFSF